MHVMDGKIIVHSPERFNALFRDSCDKSGPAEEESLPLPLCASSTSPAVQMKSIEEWLSRKARRSAVYLPEDKDLSTVKDVCKQISDREKDLLEDLSKYLDTQSEHNQSKTEMLYKKWMERVFEPIHRKLGTHMDLRYSLLDSKKRVLFSEYLAYKNKHSVFLDTINKEEYDPLSWLCDDTFRVSTGPLDDPLLQQSRALETDHLVLSSCNDGMGTALSQPCPLLGREDTDALMWLAIQLVYIDSEARKRSRQSRCRLHDNSDVEQGVWSSRHIPHKRVISYPRTPLKLEWKEPLPPTTVTITTHYDKEDSSMAS